MSEEITKKNDVTEKNEQSSVCIDLMLQRLCIAE